MVKQRKNFTIEEYLLAEQRASYKSEYYDGKIVAMSGGTPLHSQIGVKTTAALDRALQGKDCNVYNSDLKVQVGQVFVYPDASVVCGELAYYKEHSDVITNPVLIAEILSPSTSHYDKTGKFMRYRQLPSFQEYVLIQSEYPEIHVYQRQADDKWLLTPYTDLQNDQIALISLNIELPMSAFYDGVKLP